jgi:hypothetical protein
MPTRDETLSVPVYENATGLPRRWPTEYALKVELLPQAVSIRGDASGLRGLAVQLLALAGAGVPSGYHCHLDGATGELDPESIELVVVRA